MNCKTSALTAVLLICIFNKTLLAAQDKTFSLGDAGKLHLSLPDGWTGDDDGQAPTTVTLKSPAGKFVSIQIRPLSAVTEQNLKAAATMIGDHYAEQSREKKTTLEEIKGKDVHGFVSSFAVSTKPGNPRYVTAGVLQAGATTLAVTVLYNEKDSADRTAAMDALKTFSVTGGHVALPKEMRVKSPDGSWTLVVPGPWKVSEDDKTNNGKGREITATSEDGNSMLTLFLDPAADPAGDAAAARAFYLDRMNKDPLPMDHLKKDTVGETAVLEYDQGAAGFKDHNVHAYLSHAGIWIDLHWSRSDFDEKTDRAVIDGLLKGLKIQ